MRARRRDWRRRSAPWSLTLEPERHHVVPHSPRAATPHRDHDELLAGREPVGHRRGLAALGQWPPPQLAARLYVEGWEPAVQRGTDEHHTAPRHDRTPETARVPLITEDAQT